MCFFAMVLDEVGLVGCCTHEGSVWIDAGMCDEGDIDIMVSVGTSVEKLDLAAAALFCWRAEEDYFAG